MEFISERVDIITGGERVVFVPETVALDLDLHPMDRVEVMNARDITKRSKATVQFWSAGKSTVGLCMELADSLAVHDSGYTVIRPVEKPLSVDHIIQRMNGLELSGEQMRSVVQDISTDSLSEAELSCFVTSCTMQDLSMAELYNLTRHLAESGDTLDWGDEIVADKHCTGGVPGNRTSPIVVSIIASLGVMIPKASSRAITSPAGTADVMETMTGVAFTKEQITEMVWKNKGCLIWGGGLNVAPADSRLITIRKPLNSNPEGLLISSILSKKYAMGSKYVLVDMPVGLETRYHSLGEVRHMAQKVTKIAARLGMRAQVEITYGDEPIGNGIGPYLEARDVLRVLMNRPSAPADLKDKALRIAGKLIDLFGPEKFGSDHRAGDGHEIAAEALNSGKALHKFQDILESQGGNRDVTPESFKMSLHNLEIRAPKDGRLVDYDNRVVAKIARLAGSPSNPATGIDIYKKAGENVTRGEMLMMVHMGSDDKRAIIMDHLKQNRLYLIE